MAQPGDPLTPQQIRCLQAVYEYGTISAAAKFLHVSYDTVNTHLDSVRIKTGLHHLQQLTVWAERQGYLKGLEPKQVVREPQKSPNRGKAGSVSCG